MIQHRACVWSLDVRGGRCRHRFRRVRIRVRARVRGVFVRECLRVCASTHRVMEASAG